MHDSDSPITTIDAVLSADQSIIQLQFVRCNGLTTYINIPARESTSFVQNVGRAIEKSVARQEGHAPPVLPG